MIHYTTKSSKQPITTV